MSLADESTEGASLCAPKSGSAIAPAISLIIPIHNGGRYLKQCLESVLSQDFSDFELICVDDASTDESPGILEWFAQSDSRLVLLRNTERSGAARSRNAGLGQAKGEFLLFVDCDDLLAPGALGVLHRRATEDQVSLVRGNLQEFSDNPAVPPGEWLQISEQRQVPFTDLPQLWIPWGHTAWLIERAFVERTGACFPPLALGEDPVFLATLLTSSSRISTVGHLCYQYRVGHKDVAITVSDLRDFIHHAKEVKTIFLAAGAERCWHEGYAPVALNGTLYYLSLIRHDEDLTRELCDSARAVFSDGDAERDELIVERFMNHKPRSMRGKSS